MDKHATRTYHYMDYYLSDLAVVAVYSWTGPHRNPWCESVPVSMVLLVHKLDGSPANMAMTSAGELDPLVFRADCPGIADLTCIVMPARI